MYLYKHTQCYNVFYKYNIVKPIDLLLHYLEFKIIITYIEYLTSIYLTALV